MKFHKVTPNLVVANMEKSLTFYRDTLGFSVSQTVPDKAPFIFAWMKRDDADIFLNANMPPQPGEPDLYAGKPVGGGTLSLYLVMEGIDELYAKRSAAEGPNRDCDAQTVLWHEGICGARSRWVSADLCGRREVVAESKKTSTRSFAPFGR